MHKKDFRLYHLCGLVSVLSVLGACSGQNVPVQDSMRLTNDRLARMSMQSRNFNVSDQSELLRAVMNVLQDQHYTIREVNARIGTVYADQTYDIGQPLSFFGIPITHFHQKPWGSQNVDIQMGPLGFGGIYNTVYLAKKNSSVSVITFPLDKRKGYEVHVSVEVRSFYNDGQVGDIWVVKDPKMYQSFFMSLSKAVYLQANHMP